MIAPVRYLRPSATQEYIPCSQPPLFQWSPCPASSCTNPADAWAWGFSALEGDSGRCSHHPLKVGTPRCEPWCSPTAWHTPGSQWGFHGTLLYGSDVVGRNGRCPGRRYTHACKREQHQWDTHTPQKCKQKAPANLTPKILLPFHTNIQPAVFTHQKQHCTVWGLVKPSQFPALQETAVRLNHHTSSRSSWLLMRPTLTSFSPLHRTLTCDNSHQNQGSKNAKFWIKTDQEHAHSYYSTHSSNSSKKTYQQVLQSVT